MSHKKNPRIGSSFNSLLKEDGIYDEVTSTAIKRSLAMELVQAMETQSITKAGDGPSHGNKPQPA